MVAKFKTKVAVDDYLSGDEIHCLLCGKPLKTLFSHLYWKHNRLKIDDYKKMFGLPLSYGVVAKTTSLLMAANMSARLKSGIATPISPESRWKGQHSPKRNHAPYHIEALKEKGFIASQKRKIKSLDRIRTIDWDAFLSTVRTSGKGINTLGKMPGMPSSYDVQRKKEIDAVFKRKYEQLVLGQLPKHKYQEKVRHLRESGSKLNEIANVLGIGLTTVKRIIYGIR